MRKLTERDIANIAGSTVAGYHVEAVRVKNGPFIDSDHYGYILGKNTYGHYVTWQFHLLKDESVSVYLGRYYMDNREAAVRDFNTRDQDPTPQKFKVTITETLQMTVEVDAYDQQQAEQTVSDNWHGGKYILGAENFAGVEFTAAPAGEGDTI